MITFSSGITIGPNLLINLPRPEFQVTGGTVTTNANGLYTIHTFTANDTLTLYSTQNKTFDVLLVGAGGGSVPGSATGGGGAGGVAYIPGISIYAGDYAVTYNVSVGQGVAEVTYYTERGGQGQNSSFLTYVARGGGGGGQDSGDGEQGGSGGGGGGGSGQGGSGLQPGSATGGFGANGLNGGNGLSGARGGGAGADGWNGRAFDISGTSTYYGGGGGRGRTNSQGGGETTQSLGGGGWGGGSSNPAGLNATAGAPNTGGGAGGWGTASGTPLAGGSGIIIIRYLT